MEDRVLFTPGGVKRAKNSTPTGVREEAVESDGAAVVCIFGTVILGVFLVLYLGSRTESPPSPPPYG